MKISVIGAGAWGTTIAKILGEKETDVKLWSFEKDVADSINSSAENIKFLKGIKLPKTIFCSTSIEEALDGTEAIVFVVPTPFLRRILKDSKPFIKNDVMILNAGKGIERSTLSTPSKMILDELGYENAAVLSGPNLSKEIARGLPAATVVASSDVQKAKFFQELMNSKDLRVYISPDTIGVELGGALKNVIAIAAGICDGLSLGNNAKSALMVRGIAEISRLGMSLGAKVETFFGLSGIGDLITTCQSELSRNHFVGYELAHGKKLDEILKNMVSVAEGVETSVSAKELSAKMKIEMPITNEVYEVLYKEKDPKDAITSLMTRQLKKE